MQDTEYSVYYVGMEDTLRQNLLSCAARYAEAMGLGDGTVGAYAAGDWRFFERLRAGKTFTAKKYDEVMAWFDTKWPTDTKWPAGVPRTSNARQPLTS